jgi:hypothetical protein
MANAADVPLCEPEADVQEPWNERLPTHILCGGLSMVSGLRSRLSDLIAFGEEDGLGLSDDLREQEELLRIAIRLLDGT